MLSDMIQNKVGSEKQLAWETTWICVENLLMVAELEQVLKYGYSLWLQYYEKLGEERKVEEFIASLSMKYRQASPLI